MNVTIAIFHLGERQLLLDFRQSKPRLQTSRSFVSKQVFASAIHLRLLSEDSHESSEEPYRAKAENNVTPLRANSSPRWCDYSSFQGSLADHSLGCTLTPSLIIIPLVTNLYVPIDDLCKFFRGVLAILTLIHRYRMEV